AASPLAVRHRTRRGGRLRAVVQRLHLEPRPAAVLAAVDTFARSAARQRGRTHASRRVRADAAAVPEHRTPERVARLGRGEPVMRRILDSRPGKILIVIAALAVVGAGVFYVATQRSNTYVAEFTATQGIYEGDSVRVLGVEVGTIASIESDADVSRVEMQIDDDVDVPADANALLV